MGFNKVELKGWGLRGWGLRGWGLMGWSPGWAEPVTSPPLSPGSGGHQHRRDVGDHRRDRLRSGPWVLQAEELQRPHRHGVPRGHPLLPGTVSPPVTSPVTSLTVSHPPSVPLGGCVPSCGPSAGVGVPPCPQGSYGQLCSGVLMSLGHCVPVSPRPLVTVSSCH